MSSSKRKKTQKSGTRPKRLTITSEPPVPVVQVDHPGLDVAQLTATITQTVTESIMNSLRQAGLLPSLTTANTQPTSTITSAASQEHLPDTSVGTSTPVSQITPTQTSSDSNSGQIDHSLSSSSSSARNVSGKPYVSSRAPLHALVSLKKKEKIWAGEYMDLSTLQEDDVEDICFNVRTGAVSSTLAPRKKFLNIEQWTDAFNIFASVRRLKFPDEADGLCSYMNLVRRISNERGNWYYYDANFRRLKQTIDMAWDELDSELHTLALTKKSQPFRSGRESDSAPRSYSRSTRAPIVKSCNKYNKGFPCSGCSYPHVCRDCGKSNHPQFKCWGKFSQNKSPNQAYAANNKYQQNSLKTHANPSNSTTLTSK